MSEGFDIPASGAQSPECARHHAEIYKVLLEQKGQIERLDDKFDLSVQRTADLAKEMVREVAQQICAEIKELRTVLVAPATGSGKIDIKVVMPIIYTLCGVICSLIVWFTGVRPFMPGLVSGAESALSSVEKAEVGK